jgi:hypothetical protein
VQWDIIAGVAGKKSLPGDVESGLPVLFRSTQAKVLLDDR